MPTKSKVLQKVLEQSQKDVEDSNEVERLYRRNSLFGASVILIYSISGGSLNPDISVGMAKITFSNPIALEYSMILVSIYFCWRHWLVSKSLRRKLLESVYKARTEFKWASKRLDVLSEYLIDDVVHYLDDLGQSIPVVQVHKELYKIGFINIQYKIHFKNNPQRIEIKDLNVWVFKNPLLFMAVNLKYRNAWFKNAISNTHFGDGFLPLTLTLVAVILYGLK